jgi:tetratricopeptide (TPR) repeat protein
LKQFSADKSAREAWSGLAECRMQTSDAAGASEAFLKVLGDKGLDAELDEPAERAMLGLAELNLRKGDALNAKKLALRVLTERPGSEWTDAALFATGQASEALGEPERAIGYYRKLIADHPQSAQQNAAKDRLKALGAATK